ncbi:MAG: hypothetical protein JXI43_04705 [Tissierellales bacterium]|nr:hypothetical protein [Tissierellales bacterium]
MPNSKEHALKGGISGGVLIAGYDIYSQIKVIQNDPTVNFDVSRLIGKTFLGITLGCIAGILPDLLEPAYHPHHRKLFHSKCAGVLLLSGGLNLNKLKISSDGKKLIACLLTGYLSHLYLDSQTEMGLPNY